MSYTYQPPPPPLGGRPRGSSDPSRYVPDGYQHNPSQTSNNGYLMAPSAAAPYPTTPPAYPPPNMNGPQYGQMAPYPGRAPYPANDQLSPQDPRYHNNYDGRPSYSSDGRRNSQSSVKSHRSDRSHHSHYSERPHDTRRHRSHSDMTGRDRHHHHHHHRDDDDYNRYGRRYSDGYSGRDDDDYHRHHHHHHHHSSKYDDDDSSYGKPLKRTDTHRPTLGDTVASMFSYVKDSLAPRDKY